MKFHSEGKILEKEAFISDFVAMPSSELIPILLLFSILFYVGTHLALLIGLGRIRSQHNTSTPSVSVIVAARNEEQHLPGLLKCLLNQDYSDYEVIIVDDQSTDDTAGIIRSRQSTHSYLKLISLTAPHPSMPAKKNALAEGIRASHGEILLFTDADCLPPPTWISRMIAGFEEEVGLVAGYSPYDPPSFGISARSAWQKWFFSFIRYEEFKMSLWAAGSIGIRRGWLCTGRNLAYRRKVWDEVGGFEHIKHSISGDDDLFLQLVRRRTAWQIRYVASSESHVPTKPSESLPDFIHQRTRHFSAGKYFPPLLQSFFIIFHFSNLVLYTGLVAFFVNPSVTGGLQAFSAKFVTDLVFIVVGSRYFAVSSPLFSSTFMEMAILVYNMIMGPLGLLGSFRWKAELR